MREAYYPKMQMMRAGKKSGPQTEMLATIAVKHARRDFLQFQSSPGIPVKLVLTSLRALITYSVYFL